MQVQLTVLLGVAFFYNLFSMGVYVPFARLQLTMRSSCLVSVQPLSGVSSHRIKLPLGWFRSVTALTSHLILLSGVTWSCLRSN